MGLLVDGQWVDQWYDTEGNAGRFVRQSSQYRNWITPDGSPGPQGEGGFAAQSGRYHLYVSLACPWAHRTLIYRAVKGLEAHISVSTVEPLMLENGWTFSDAGDPLYGARYLHEIYTRVDPQATTRGFPGGGGIEAAGIEHAAGPFDLVTFHHSLEHVADPRAQLVRARALLAPGGRIVVRCPTTSGAAFRRYGDRWVALDAPRHLVIPSRAGMVHLARRAGLRVESVRDDATAMQFWASEQYRRDMALMDPRSRMRAPWRPSRDWARLLGWWRATRRLNASGDGDQAAWVLAPAGEDGTPGGDPVRA